MQHIKRGDFAGEVNFGHLSKLIKAFKFYKRPVSQYEHPARLRLPFLHVSTKSLKSSLSLYTQRSFFTSETSELSTAIGIIMK